jgi:hypothetical protein
MATLTFSRTMTSLTCAFTLALGAGLAAGGTAAPARGEDTTPPNAVYLVESWKPTGADTRILLYSIRLVLVDGRLLLGSNCLSYGSGAYTAGADGAWSFAQETLSTKGCAARAASSAAFSIDALAQGVTWQWETDYGSVQGGINYGGARFIAITGPVGTLRLYPISSSWTPEPDPPDDPAQIPGIQGQWRVETITSNRPQVEDKGPFAWTAEFSGSGVMLPVGCELRSPDYAATPSGYFVATRTETIQFGVQMLIKIICPAEREEADILARALADVTRWSLPEPGRLVLSGPSTTVTLARPARTNLAFGVRIIKPEAKTVRVAVGESVSIPVKAWPWAPRAVAKAKLTWRNSHGAVAAVTTAAKAATKRTPKTGKLTVPMNTGKAGRIKVTGLKTGTARLTLVAPSGTKASIKVIVVAKPVAATKVTMKGNGNHHVLQLSTQLTATVTPANATAAVPKWTSSHPDIVQVDSHGLVTRIAVPDESTTVTITCRVGSARGTYRLKVWA